ncbi:Hypothetical predicted protein [Mytilus galloprovincialis]|uniref:Uncharacterized protein n=1 Tax=Mytilus galloprovincialis TaxID=29158 RepID=A0A8B6BZX8_MYTGA|nr:Hypothetical predicted protein [Mytilus galloprovincialis]
MKETALAELVTYIFETQRNSEESVVFQLADLANLYEERLTQLGSSAQVDSTRPKDKLLQKMPELEAHTKAGDIFLMFVKDIGPAIAFACDYNDTMYMAKTAEMIRCQCTVFTTAAVDNIDPNPSSTTSRSSFHGTGISIFQHPMKDNISVRRDELILLTHKTKSKKVVPELPAAFMNMKTAYLKTKPEPLILPDDINNILNHDYHS